MNLVTLSGYIRKKNVIKKTVKDGDSLTFVLEYYANKKKRKVNCTVFDRLVRRVDKAVKVNDKVLIHGYLETISHPKSATFIIIEKLELLDFIRIEDKKREDKKKKESKKISDKLKRKGI